MVNLHHFFPITQPPPSHLSWWYKFYIRYTNQLTKKIVLIEGGIISQIFLTTRDKYIFIYIKKNIPRIFKSPREKLTLSLYNNH